MWESKKRLAKERKIRAGWGIAGPFETPTFQQGPLAQLESEIEGTIVLPGDSAYQNDRQLANPAFQDFPQLIVYCEVNQRRSGMPGIRSV
jgi:hypothetical protein